MHELTIAESVLQLLEEQAEAQRFSRVRTVWLETGALAAVEVESLRFCFEAVTRGSLADGARLEIIQVPGRAWCAGCNAGVAISQRYEACPRCAGHRLRITQGEELRVRELEVE